MKRTRRAALVMFAGSSSLLAVDTAGFSSGESEREVTVQVADDPDAYLRLAPYDGEGDVETGGLLFEDAEPRIAPESFSVKNQLTESVTVVLESNEFEFDLVGDGQSGDGEAKLKPGTSVDVEVRPAVDSSGPTNGTIEITAEGDAILIEAKRTLTLKSKEGTYDSDEDTSDSDE
ncbi:hypothetical protein [Natrarchaeobaculum sulfurireducens]|uniref:DUF1102 domain-containing protein n=1 Tax=Natrarchaeobaculum sulfurireducens TaxID=2044521 RepID=A0A346PTS5_9EURY|nr:hypothetical protein [Natrarchaeobaculum sulfurireducens]AXR82920.1 hypothetical protein AArcMg_2931 [Natrarchaeobaculum sulfurireducens]